jgi:hypothetical protein
MYVQVFTQLDVKSSGLSKNPTHVGSSFWASNRFEMVAGPKAFNSH